MLNEGRKKKGLTLTQRGSQAKKKSITVAFRGVCVWERQRQRERDETAYANFNTTQSDRGCGSGNSGENGDRRLKKNPSGEEPEGKDEGWNPGTAAVWWTPSIKILLGQCNFRAASSMRSGQVRSVSDNLVSSWRDSTSGRFCTKEAASPQSDTAQQTKCLQNSLWIRIRYPSYKEPMESIWKVKA